ncbi:MAG: hypothetical protein LBR14_02605 [Clostridiales Family XIII bacterium]|jgi:hypothetical protein|nr:hypothetical protein [Clostridiales Family XIII bacterium]
MIGQYYVAQGGAVQVRDLVYGALQQAGFSVAATGEWSATAERGSQGKSVMLGALAGKKGRHVIIGITFSTDAQGNTVVQLTEGATGISGGVIGIHQAETIYRETYNHIGQTLQAQGLLLTGGDV